MNISRKKSDKTTQQLPQRKNCAREKKSISISIKIKFANVFSMLMTENDDGWIFFLICLLSSRLTTNGQIHDDFDTGHIPHRHACDDRFHSTERPECFDFPNWLFNPIGNAQHVDEKWFSLFFFVCVKFSVDVDSAKNPARIDSSLTSSFELVLSSTLFAY